MTPDVVEAMKPDFVAPLVGYLVHPDTWVTSRIFESASGWNAEVRWQRTGGYVFPLPHTAEDIRDHWKEVNGGS
jgi:multifunctional beta-oxidation protein